jgi:crossover junction endodeoxyribonuclease RusA
MPEVLLCEYCLPMTSKTLILTVPFPPSVNTYWGFRGSQRFLTANAKSFKQTVLQTYQASKHQGFQTMRLSVCIKLFAPDRRIRDIDNYAKSLIDALCQAGIFVDDEQIDHLNIVRNEVFKGGKCIVTIAAI